MPGRAKCQPDCVCEKHNRPRMTPEEQKESQRRASRMHYHANRVLILDRQRNQRRDPVVGDEIRARERARVAALTPEERARRAQLNRDWYRQNPRSAEENTRQHMRFRYGLTPERWAQMLEEQQGLCYLCGEPLPDGKRAIHVDHDHACCRGSRSCGTCIRGLACNDCNLGIGLFGDDPERLRRVADNLEMANAKLRVLDRPAVLR